jgi:predicted  nucleic acid-binding Zn-ribbon protein
VRQDFQVRPEHGHESLGGQDLPGRADTLQPPVGQQRDAVLAEVERNRTDTAARRAEVAAGLDGELLKIYERQRAASGIGAGRLQGGRCGACRIELDRGELARISAAPDDDVLRCGECGAILLRLKD